MPRHSETGNVRKFCVCPRGRRFSCPHPWFTDYSAPSRHPLRGGQRFRRNLDAIAEFHPSNLAEAKTEARRAIDAWLAGRDPHELQPSDRPTLAHTLDAYHARPDAPVREREQFAPICRTVIEGRRFGDWRLADITRDALLAFQLARPKCAGNRNLALLRSVFKWAVLGGLVEATPFRHGGIVVVKLRQELPRTRRLLAGEYDRLLAGAGPDLAALIIAAVESGMRRGELLTLQWAQVRFEPRAEIYLPASKTKTRTDRRVPVSSVLRQTLTARRCDPAGVPLPPEAYVFGDAVGRRRRSIKTAWRLLCRRAGVTGLRLHDLRREAGSRWMDAGVPLATIQRWLGHANISQTSTYLGASLGGDAADMDAYEQRAGRVPALTQPDPKSDPTGREPLATVLDVLETPTKAGVVH